MTHLAKQVIVSAEIGEVGREGVAQWYVNIIHALSTQRYKMLVHVPYVQANTLCSLVPPSVTFRCLKHSQNVASASINAQHERIILQHNGLSGEGGLNRGKTR